MSFALQEGKFALFGSPVKLLDALIYPTLSFHNQSIIKAGQNARHGFDCFVASQLGPKIPAPCAEITVRTYQCLRGHSKRISYAIGAVFAYMRVVLCQMKNGLPALTDRSMSSRVAAINSSSAVSSLLIVSG